MRYHIDTIPVWDAVKLGTECPLCALRRREEQGQVERFLGGSVMEPDTRIQVNEKGFCARHHVLLYAQQNRLGHALMTHTHLKETDKRLEKILADAVQGAQAAAGAPLMKRAFGKDGGKEAVQAAAEKLEQLTNSCILCDRLQDSMERYAYTLLHLFSNDSAFRKAFEASRGVCLKDAALLLRMAPEALNAKQQAEFTEVLQRLIMENMHRLEDELEWFTLKFDYRNADKPWNNSRDALERAVTKLRGWCVGAEPDGNKK